jgi:Fe2+ or Zn2+ uptake regulation protein
MKNLSTLQKRILAILYTGKGKHLTVSDVFRRLLDNEDTVSYSYVCQTLRMLEYLGYVKTKKFRNYTYVKITIPGENELITS